MLFDGIRDLKLKNTIANWSINANATPNLLTAPPTLIAQFYETNTTAYLSPELQNGI